MYKKAHAASVALFAQYRALGNACINKHLLQIMALLLPMRRVCSGESGAVLQHSKRTGVGADMHVEAWHGGQESWWIGGAGDVCAQLCWDCVPSGWALIRPPCPPFLPAPCLAPQAAPSSSEICPSRTLCLGSMRGYGGGACPAAPARAAWSPQTTRWWRLRRSEWG